MGRRQASIPLVNISGRNDSLNIPDAPEHEVAEKNVFYFRGAGMEKAPYSAESHTKVKAEENWASTTHQYRTSSNHRAPLPG